LLKWCSKVEVQVPEVRIRFVLQELQRAERSGSVGKALICEDQGDSFCLQTEARHERQDPCKRSECPGMSVESRVIYVSI